MIGPRYWSTGVKVAWQSHAGIGAGGVTRSGWSATIEFCDDGFCDDDADTRAVSTEGKLRSRYAVSDGDEVDGLTAVLDVILADAARLGINMRPRADMPCYLHFGEAEDAERPDGWAEMLRGQAARLGLTCPTAEADLRSEGGR